ncbi:hypothetical protein AXG93_4242s1230 [Marchantia polymorpha subsp. ruderalis]|uniref:AIG1-type G domain-containing protein n=1 Tax=Marchantia polymorpha subsp. ruderalis TaxID=1480154 RepID=A0A176VWX8_MARPO|nr:hypothetical protein AXG93_4242s1230 [Marchantia polymorpha subsp. ruderalis]
MFTGLCTFSLEVPMVSNYRKMKRELGACSREAEEREKKVILFGRTGADKTNVANALVTGGLGTAVFELENHGKSIEIKFKRGRGWSVTDTVGGLSLAEAEMKSRSAAVDTVTNLLKRLRGEYSHIIYCKSAMEVSSAVDHLIWLAYEQIFAGAEEAYVVLYTGGDEVREKRQAAVREKEVEKLEKRLQEIFESKDQGYFRPSITDMDDEQLREKSEALLIFLAEKIQSMLHPNLWMKVASKLSSFFPLVWYFREIGSTKSAIPLQR